MKAKLFLGLKLATSIGLLAYLYSLIDIRYFFNRLEHFKLMHLGLALVLLLAQSLISAWKWKVILKSEGTDLGLRFLWKTYLIGNFLSLFLPSSFGGDVYRVAALRNQLSMTRSAASVLFDRLTGLLALLTLGLGGYVSVFHDRFAAVFVLAYLLGIAVFHVATNDISVARLSLVKSKVTNVLARLLTSFNAYRKNPSALGKILLISLLFQFNIVVVNQIYCLSLGTQMPFVTLMIIVPLAYLTEVLPISINGIGVRESALVFLFTLFGYSIEEGLALGILIVLMRYCVGLLGGFVLLTSILRGSKPLADAT